MRSRAFLHTRPRVPELQLPVTAGLLPGCVGPAPIASTVSAMDPAAAVGQLLGVTTIAATRNRTPPFDGSAIAVAGDQAGLVPGSSVRAVLHGRAGESAVIDVLLAGAT